MKIRTQNLLAIVPIFLGIAIISSFLNYTEQLAEIKWGVHEEIKALATTTAGFIDEDVCRKLLNGELDPKRSDISLILQRIVKLDSQKKIMTQKQHDNWVNRIWISIWKQLQSLSGNQQQEYSTWAKLQHFFIVAPDGGRQIIYKPDKEYWKISVSKPIEEIKNIIERIEQVDDKVYLSAPEPGSAIMKAYAPIVGRSGTLAGILGVEISTENIRTQKGMVLLKISIISLITILFGALITLFISGIITRKIRELSEAAGVVAEGHYDRRVNIETIQEVIDLGNTFNTMSSVLEEVLSRTKRELIERRQFRTQADLAKTYNETFFEPQERTFGDIEIAARLISKRPTGDFFGVFQVDSGSIYAVLGRVRAEEELDSVTFASAAFSLIRQELSKIEPEQVFKNVCELFDVETWECIYWDEAGSKIQWLGHNPNGGPPLQRTMPLQKQKTLVFHTSRETTGETIDSYVRLFGYLLPVELMEDLMGILDEESEGSLITIGKRSITPPD